MEYIPLFGCDGKVAADAEGEVDTGTSPRAESPKDDKERENDRCSPSEDAVANGTHASMEPAAKRQCTEEAYRDRRLCTPIMFHTTKSIPSTAMSVPRAQWDQTIELNPYDPASLHTEACAHGRDRVTRSASDEAANEDENDGSAQENEGGDEEDPSLSRKRTEVSPTRPSEGEMNVPRPASLQQLDRYLDFVATTYYQVSESGCSTEEFALLRRSMLGQLTSPLRKPSIVDKWAPREVALFESCMCLFGKEFSKMQRVIPTKTTKDIVEFYYVWKKSKNYLKWKETFRPPAV